MKILETYKAQPLARGDNLVTVEDIIPDVIEKMDKYLRKLTKNFLSVEHVLKGER